MADDPIWAHKFLNRWHPFDLLPQEALDKLDEGLVSISFGTDDSIFAVGDAVEYLYVVCAGAVELRSPEGVTVSHLMTGETFGARALFRAGKSGHAAVAVEPTRLLAVPAATFHELLAAHSAFDTYFDRLREQPARRLQPASDTAHALISASIQDVMTPDPAVIPPDSTIREAAQFMHEKNISCVLVGAEGQLSGILTTGDLAGRVVATGADIEGPVSGAMTKSPFTLQPEALVFDAMIEMSSRGFGHLPITRQGKPVGIVTRTDLVRRRSVSAIYMIADLWRLEDNKALASVIAGLPQLLAQLVGSGVDAYRVGHVITGVADALTKRLLFLAERELGSPPVPYLWLACGSQGRREQTGISDQDNCLMLDDRYDEAAHGPYFEKLARFVSDGLDVCGYFYCPGDMMATNPKWRQPVRVWRSYFADWIERPNPMAQMLASVMFDLRPIDGDRSLFEGVREQTLAPAPRNSIFRAHMISNSLKHTPPLGLFRGFALIRSGEHKDTVDLKHSGVVPIVDLARVYALQGGIEPVNTRERLLGAQEAGTLSAEGGRDLIDAFDLISDIRLEHQARLVREGRKPDNFLAPASLSALERNHLKDAFGVVKTMQSALSHSSA